MITLKDIAKECKVSFSTVSKALKGSPEISQDTISLIQKKAAEMGYHPNIAARTLRTSRTYNLGVIFEDKTGAGFQHQYFAKIISGFQDVAQTKDYEITFMSYNRNKQNDYFNHSKSRNFDGVAILSANFSNPSIKQLVESDIPTVTLDYIFDNTHTAVLSDNTKGMSELVEYVIQMGHTKIAMIHGEQTLVTEERKKIFLEICKKHNIKIPENYFAEALYHDPMISAEATNILLSLPEPPTCIFYPDDYSALGGIREINSRKLTLGQDISIVGYDGIMLTSMMIPPLTTYEQDGVKMGNLMAESLINKIENKKLQTEGKIIVGGRMLKGGSVANIK